MGVEGRKKFDSIVHQGIISFRDLPEDVRESIECCDSFDTPFWEWCSEHSIRSLYSYDVFMRELKTWSKEQQDTILPHVQTEGDWLVYLEGEGFDLDIHNVLRKYDWDDVKTLTGILIQHHW